MWKSTETKIFIGFATLTILEFCILVFLFGRIILRETETYIYDALSRRAHGFAAELQAKLEAPGTTIESLLTKEMIFVGSDGQIPHNSSLPFPVSEIDTPSMPQQGTVVTECSPHYLCAITFIPRAQGWIIDWTETSSISALALRIAEETAPSLILFILLGILLSFLIARALSKPLRQMVPIAREVAQGRYENINLPTHRKDEIGNLARALEKMIFEIKEREHNIALTGVRLAHSSRLSSLGQMGASLAHEVKNPLMAMMGYAKILKTQVNQPDAKEAVEIIVKEGERCQQILQQILRFSRSDKEESKPYAVQELIESALLLLKAEAKAHEVLLKSDIQANPILKGHPQHLQQIIINLVLNAIQASPPGSEVIVRLRESPTHAVIQVDDSGTGISPEIKARIFDPFFTTKEKGAGTGLGLSVAEDIVRNEGGTLSFENRHPRGTRFEIALPLPT